MLLNSYMGSRRACQVLSSRCVHTCDLDSSTSILAAGWVTTILFMIVAPSLVITTSPFGWDTWPQQRR